MTCTKGRSGTARAESSVRHSRALLVLLLVGLAPGLGCARHEAAAPPPRAVLMIVIDTMRGDRFGAAGYSRAITPTLDSLAASGVRFSDAMTPVPVTLPAVSSLMTGRTPPRHSVRDNDKFVLPESEETLAEQFRAAGWRTGAVLGSAVLNADRGLARGFEVYDDNFSGPFPVYDPTLAPLVETLGRSQRRADRVTDLALRQIDSFGTDRFFLFVHYFDVHMFYDPPPAWRARHPDDLYDGEVSFVDAELGRLLRALRGRDDLLVLVVSDHGESNGEHGEPQHGFLLYQSTLHVVALASGAGVPRGVVRKDNVSLVDLAPTVSRLCRLPQNDTPRDGRALEWRRPIPSGVPRYAETLRPLVSYNWSELRAIRRGPWKLIEGGGRAELYNLEVDPHERNNLGTGPSLKAMRHDLVEASRGDDAEEIYREARGQPTTPRNEMLEGLGYIGGGEGAARRPRRPHPLDALPGFVATQEAKSLVKKAYSGLMGGDAGTAIALLDRSLELDPKLADAWFLRGYARKLLGRRAEALNDFRACLDLRPGDATSRMQVEELTRTGTREADIGAPPHSGSPHSGSVDDGLGALSPAGADTGDEDEGDAH